MMKNKIYLKTPAEIEIMAEGGKKLGQIKKKLKQAVKEGVRAEEIDKLAEDLIAKAGGQPSFKMVPGYLWSTCININEGVVHGVPAKEIIFKKGDLVSVDIGMYYRGFHTDTSFSMAIDSAKEIEKFLAVGKKALAAAIANAKPNKKVHDISWAIESTLKKAGLSPIKALVGHGIGRHLHEEPQIPCFTQKSRKQSPKIEAGAVLAIEVMYTKGKPEVKVSQDGWTIVTNDGKIAGLFEETVAVTKDGPLVLTR